MTRQNRVVWSEEEWDRLADETWKLRLEKPESNFLTLVNEAQHEAFPPDRRRKLLALSNVPALGERIKERSQAQALINEEVQKLREQIAALQRERSEVHAKQPSDAEIYARHSDAVLRMATVEDILAHISVEDVLQELETPNLVGIAATRLAESLTNNSSALVDLLMESVAMNRVVIPPRPQTNYFHQNHYTEEPAQPTRLPRVALLGLKPEQLNIMRRRLAGHADVVPIDKKRKVQLPHCDYYLLWARFVSHPLQDQVRSVAKPEQIIVHHGGLEKMAEAIADRL